jgi:hypothetical protein
MSVTSVRQPANIAAFMIPGFCPDVTGTGIGKLSVFTVSWKKYVTVFINSTT